MNRSLQKECLSDIARECHETACAHGWWDEEKALREAIQLATSTTGPRRAVLLQSLQRLIDAQKYMLFVTELCEGFEGIRNGISDEPDEHCPEHPNEAVELADVIIRVFDYAEHYDIDVCSALLAKMEFNKTRPYKHGKNF